MVATPQRCQHYSLAQCLVAWQLAGVAVLGWSCLGCWQEIRYEPAQSGSAADSSNSAATGLSDQGASPQEGLGVASTSAAPVEATAVEVDVPTMAVPVTAAPQSGPELQPAATSAATSAALFGEPELADTAVQPSPAPIARATWQMSSRWSMAAARQAKGRSSESYGGQWEQALDAAEMLGVTLPKLPTHEGDADRLAENLNFLLESAGPRLASELSRQYGADAAALAELATKTHVLLLSYTPSSTRLEPVIASILQAAERSGLPESVWQELVDLLTARADFRQVKAAIFRLHERAAAHLSSAAR